MSSFRNGIPQYTTESNNSNREEVGWRWQLLRSLWGLQFEQQSKALKNKQKKEANINRDAGAGASSGSGGSDDAQLISGVTGATEMVGNPLLSGGGGGQSGQGGQGGQGGQTSKAPVRPSIGTSGPEVHYEMDPEEKTRRLSAFAGPPDGLAAGTTAKLYLLHTLCMVVLAMIPADVFLLVFSDISFGMASHSAGEFRLGHGAEVHAFLVSKAALTSTVAGGTFLLFLTLYLLDVSYWEGHWLVAKKFFFAVGGVGIIAVSLLCSNWMPAAPLGVFCILICVYTHIASTLIYPDLARSDYFIGLSHVLFAIGAVMLSVWCTSTFTTGGQGMWSYTVEQSLRERINCDPVPTPGSTEPKQDCTAAYLIWIGPLLGTAASWVAAVFSRVIGKALARQSNFGGARIVVGSVLAIGFGMWCGASVSSTSSTISQVGY
jgi:hypothetical protein